MFSLLPTEYVISNGRRGVDFHYKVGAVVLPQSGGTIIKMRSVYGMYVIVNPTIAVT